MQDGADRSGNEVKRINIFRLLERRVLRDGIFNFQKRRAKPGRFGGGGGAKAYSPLPFPKHRELLGGKSLQFPYSPFPLPTGKSVPPFLHKLRPRVPLGFDGLWWFGESRQLSTMSCFYFFFFRGELIRKYSASSSKMTATEYWNIHHLTTKWYSYEPAAVFFSSASSGYGLLLLPFCFLRNSKEEATRVDNKEQIFPREPQYAELADSFSPANVTSTYLGGILWYCPYSLPPFREVFIPSSAPQEEPDGQW